jgi:hypothetical protein
MWFAAGIVIGFFVGFVWCALFSSRANQVSIKRLRKENEALARKVYLLEHIYRSRRAKKLRYKTSSKETTSNDA